MKYSIKTYKGPLGESLSTVVYHDTDIVTDISENSFYWNGYLAWLAEGNTPEPWEA